MPAPDTFTNLLSEIHLHLKPFGFKKKASYLYLKKDNNWLLINLQKSTSNTADNISFTINLAIASQALREWQAQYESFTDPTKTPDIANAHWRVRIGSLLDGHQDKWWEIKSNTSLTQLTQDILPLLTQKAIPYLEARLSDEQILSAWEKGEYGGQTEYTRDKWLLAMASLLHKPDLPNRITAHLAKYSQKKGYPERDYLKDLGFPIS